MLIRILAAAVLLFSVLFMPLWVSAILALAGMFYFHIFWEAVLLFLISDLLYGVKDTRLWNLYFVSFFISLILILIIEIVKKKLRYYQ